MLGSPAGSLGPGRSGDMSAKDEGEVSTKDAADGESGAGVCVSGMGKSTEGYLTEESRVASWVSLQSTRLSCEEWIGEWVHELRKDKERMLNVRTEEMSRKGELLKIYFILCVYVFTRVCMQVSMEARKGHQRPWSWSYSHSKPPTMGAGSQSQVLCKSTKCS